MILAELEYRATHRIESFYPETGPLRRELYPRHMEFFAAGARHNERLFLGGNRVGKSEGVGAFECVLHLTGKYPAWWRGRRFSHPVAVWAAGMPRPHATFYSSPCSAPVRNSVPA